MALETWIVWLSIVGAVDSLYTALQQKFPQLFEYCFDKDFERVDCHEILHSKYASIFKIVPNSWIGAASYTLLAIIYWVAPSFLVVGADRLYLVGALIATAGLAVSYYLLYVQAKILEKWCIFCLTSTALMTAISIMAWLAIP